MTRASGSYLTTASAGTVTSYRTGAGAISGYLNQVMTRSNDTGQVNFATLTTQTSLSSNRDYEIFQFNDTLQNTKPVFIKFNWGTDGINLTIGTATNGTGTITAGNTATGPGLAFQLIYTISTNVITRYAYVSSDGSYLAFIANCQPASATNADTTVGFVLERTRDGDGTPNGDGLMLWKWAPANTSGDAATTTLAPSFQYAQGKFYDVNNPQPAQVYDFAATPLNAANISTWTTPTAAFAFPVYGHIGNTLYGASKAIMLGGINDFTRLNTYTINNNGSAQNWIALGAGSPVYQSYAQSLTTATAKLYSPMIRMD